MLITRVIFSQHLRVRERRMRLMRGYLTSALHRACYRTGYHQEQGLQLSLANLKSYRRPNIS